ncbi:uncharacterized protein LOC132380419 isoform X2 [Hypanus sabinus]|nr:uncharacterized protein LOC132380419 isoform X2 [Hypanus sabinus]
MDYTKSLAEHTESWRNSARLQHLWRELTSQAREWRTCGIRGHRRPWRRSHWSSFEDPDLEFHTDYGTRSRGSISGRCSACQGLGPRVRLGFGSLGSRRSGDGRTECGQGAVRVCELQLHSSYGSSLSRSRISPSGLLFCNLRMRPGGTAPWGRGTDSSPESPTEVLQEIEKSRQRCTLLSIKGPST